MSPVHSSPVLMQIIDNEYTVKVIHSNIASSYRYLGEDVEDERQGS
jgi:hypothetical protein